MKVQEMKTTTLFKILLVAGAASAASVSYAGSASDAVTKMAKKKTTQIDRTTTSSVKSESTFDARGVVMPNAEVTLAAGVAAEIQRMPFKAGQVFRKGDTLVEFDCARQLADLRGAKASLGKANSYYQGKRRLKSRGAAGSQEVREAAADVATATATVDALSEVINLCKVSAPFNGRVVERHSETHEIPAANAPLLTVVDDSELELDLIVPSTWLRWVRQGSRFGFVVDELGKTYDAKVVRLGAKVDAVSQTIKITGKFVSRPGSVLAGMSGTGNFEPVTN